MAIKKKPKFITDNIIRSSKGTSYVRYSTSAHPNGCKDNRKSSVS